MDMTYTLAPPPPDTSSSSSPPPPPEDSSSSSSSSPPTSSDSVSGSHVEDDYSPPEKGAGAPDLAPSPSRHKHKHCHKSSSDDSDSSVLTGVIIGGILILAIVVIYFLRKKKKQQYDPDRKVLPVQGKSQLGPINPNQKPPADNFGKINPPPGGGWVAPSPPPKAQPGGGYIASPPPPMVQPDGGYAAPLPPPKAQSTAKGQFTYEELAVATNKFSNDNLLGQGSSGIVHKGILSDGTEVAIKTLKAGSGQSDHDFLAEIDTLTRLHHRHLVPILGCCIAGDNKLLVYEFIPNKTMEFHLHGKGEPIMDWATRTRIAMGSAKGLAYLHEDCNPGLIHRNIKAANILLDKKFEAMVSDFGLAKLTTDNYTHVSTRMMGTFGYMAPEYAASGKLTQKSDVYSYGIILLELITGRRAVDPKYKAMDDNLVDWARPLLSKAMESGDYSILVDPRLEESYVPDEMARMIACAAAAIRHSARRRPRMSQIVRALDGASSLDDLNDDVKYNNNNNNNNNKSKSTNNEKTPAPADRSPATSLPYNPVMYDTRQFNADLLKYKDSP